MVQGKDAMPAEVKATLWDPAVMPPVIRDALNLRLRLAAMSKGARKGLYDFNSAEERARWRESMVEQVAFVPEVFSLVRDCFPDLRGLTDPSEWTGKLDAVRALFSDAEATSFAHAVEAAKLADWFYDTLDLYLVALRLVTRA